METIKGDEVAIIKDRLYFVTVLDKEELEDKYSKYRTFSYDMAFLGRGKYFGPLTISEVYQFSNILSNKLTKISDKPILFYTLTTGGLQASTNAAFLIGCYMVQTLGTSLWEASLILDRVGPFLRFHNPCKNDLGCISIVDCLMGYKKALYNFFHIHLFCLEKYLYCKNNLKLNWIIPNKMIAFKSPMDVPIGKHHTPEVYGSYFAGNNVKIVVRLNSALYDSSSFEQFGIRHFDLEFEDMKPPSTTLVYKFLEICKIADNDGVAIAVHCKAGVGRTGTMIACYMMKTYKMTARESTAWLRMVRPSSIYGSQLKFLEEIQDDLWSM